MGKPDGWTRLLTHTKQGDIEASAANAQLIFTHDPQWKDVLAFDEFLGDVIATKLPPWPKDMRPAKYEIGDWTDLDTSRAQMWLSRTYGFNLKESAVGAAIRVVAARRIVHPVRDWLKSLTWDRRKRLDTVFIRCAGADDTPYVREVTKNFFISAVARIMKPGCQVDSMPIFEGDQGLGKTSMIRAIFSERWFLSTTIEIGTKDCYQSFRRKWGVEMGELDSLTRAEVSKSKQIISQRVDTYRPSYGKMTIDFLRQIVFAGSVNEDGSGYLKDNTGARRFWPILIRGVPLAGGRVGIDLAGIEGEREQIFAEAMLRYKRGEAYHITDKELLRQAAQVAEERRQADPWEGLLTEKLNTLVKENPKVRVRGVTTHWVLTELLGYEPSKLTRTDEIRVGTVLRIIGWSRTSRIRVDGLRERRYFPSKLKLIETADPIGHTPPKPTGDPIGPKEKGSPYVYGKQKQKE